MKSFNIEYKGKKYTFAFTRKIIAKLESEGKLSFSNEKKILESVDAMFYGALLLHHPEVTEEFATQMLDDLTQVDDNEECEYAYSEIAECLTKLIQNTFGQGAKAKKSIM